MPHPLDETTTDSWRNHVDRRLDHLESGLGENNAATSRIEANTQEIVSLFKTTKSGLRVLGVFGSMLKWLAVVAGGTVAAWAAWRGVK